MKILPVLIAALSFVATAPVSADSQDDRLASLDRMVQAGMFISHGKMDSVARIVVSELFHDAELESKLDIASLGYAYYKELDPSLTALELVDVSTGAVVGRVDDSGAVIY